MSPPLKSLILLAFFASLAGCQSSMPAPACLAGDFYCAFQRADSGLVPAGPGIPYTPYTSPYAPPTLVIPFGGGYEIIPPP